MSCDSLPCSAGEVDYDRFSFGEHSLYSWGISCMTVICFSQMTATPLWLLLVHLPLRATQLFFSGFWINYFKMISGSDSTLNEQSHKRTSFQSKKFKNKDSLQNGSFSGIQQRAEATECNEFRRAMTRPSGKMWDTWPSSLLSAHERRGGSRNGTRRATNLI